MSIDARIKDVKYNRDGTAWIGLEDREPSGCAGQPRLKVLNPPKAPLLESAVGHCIWGGGSGAVMMGDKPWADRIGYTKIRLRSRT